jgi:C1A family cysteine protease
MLYFSLLIISLMAFVIVDLVRAAHKAKSSKPQHQYKLKRQKPDERDIPFDHQAFLGAAPLPSGFDLRPGCPPVRDQGQEGSCTSFAGTVCREMLAEGPSLILAPACLYYEERALESTTLEDSGASIRDECKATQKFGICPETDMPYVAGDYTTAPSAQAVTDAAPYKISAYKAVLGAEAVKIALVSRKQPVLIGMTVYASMESDAVAKSGILPIPKNSEQKMGGHAVLIVGYKDAAKPSLCDCIRSLFTGKSTGNFIVRNSWGDQWGLQGYFQMSYEYFSKYTYDYWIMEK